MIDQRYIAIYKNVKPMYIYTTTACIILIDLSQCVIINLYDTRTLYCDGGNGGEEEKLYAIGELLKIKARSLVNRSGGD